MTENGSYDWNDTIESDGDVDRTYTPIPEGDYVFEVEDIERGEFPGSEKIPQCNKVRLTLRITDPNGYSRRIRDDLFLNRKMDWKISGFFRSVGMKLRGVPLRMDWDQLPGRTGFAHIRIHRYDSGSKIANQVAYYIDPDPAYVGADGFQEIPDDGDLPF